MRDITKEINAALQALDTSVFWLRQQDLGKTLTAIEQIASQLREAIKLPAVVVVNEHIPNDAAYVVYKKDGRSAVTRIENWPQQPPQPQTEPEAPPKNPWREAIDEALVVSCLDCTSDNEPPEAALARLVAWEINCALDPAISSEARALIERGKLEKS